jgi:peptidoglycan-associated lipoprotein
MQGGGNAAVQARGKDPGQDGRGDSNIEVTMRGFLISLAVLLVLAAGCANNRPTAGDIAPSRQAALTDPGAGWSVPPGQKHVTDPAPAGQVGAAQEQPDEAALAAAERRKRQDAARAAREQIAAQPQARPAAPPPAQAQPRREPVVAPLVPAFPVRMQEARVPTLRRVNFAFDQWELSAESRAMLDENARWLKANPEVVVQVAGHADERGTPEYNLALGERRARRVREYLITQGVPADNLVTASYGEEVPLVQGHDEASWSQNRRAEFNRIEGRRVSGGEPRKPSS